MLPSANALQQQEVLKREVFCDKRVAAVGSGMIQPFFVIDP
jgi:hypothetical protein